MYPILADFDSIPPKGSAMGTNWHNKKIGSLIRPKNASLVPINWQKRVFLRHISGTEKRRFQR
jgi:hypothetical protein